MARGQIIKEDITKKILEVFPNSFISGKEIRIPGNENGELVQIKVTLTAAKDNIEPEGSAATVVEKSQIPVQASQSTVSAEEKANIAKMLEALGM